MADFSISSYGKGEYFPQNDKDKKSSSLSPNITPASVKIVKDEPNYKKGENVDIAESMGFVRSGKNDSSKTLPSNYPHSSGNFAIDQFTRTNQAITKTETKKVVNQPNFFHHRTTQTKDKIDLFEKSPVEKQSKIGEKLSQIFNKLK